MARLTSYDININCGADFVLSFLIRDGNGQLIDLTGATITATIREFPESTEYQEFVATHNSTGGKITLVLPHEITELISYSYGCYDVYIEHEGGTREKVLFGNAKIISSVTRFVNDGIIVLMVTLSNEEALPVQGDMSRLYFCTESGIIYRWNGTAYVSVMRNSSVAIGETTTLEPGEDATVTNTGTITDLILNFGIPAGNDGQDGADGQDGQDGFSPSASVSKSGNKTTISITDKDGTTTADVLDGEGAGDVIGPNSSTDSRVAVFDGNTGKAIKDSGYTIGKSVPADAEFTDTKYSSTTGTIGSASEGEAITADEIDSWSAGVPTSVSVDNGVLIIANGTASALSYTSKSIPNISVTDTTVVTGISES